MGIEVCKRKDVALTASTFTEEKFGWLNRQWKHHDHLVLFGFNKGTGRWYRCEMAKTHRVLATIGLPVFGYHSPLVRARKLFHHYDPTNYLGAKFFYEGSLRVSTTAVSHRHIVRVTIDGMEEDMKKEIGYQEFNPGELDQAFAHYMIPVVKHIIGRLHERAAKVA